MSHTFNPGDRVRRTTDHTSGLYPEGYEFNVGEHWGECIYEEGEAFYAHDPDNLERVTPAPVEFQKGDRVRATAKEGDDFAVFTVTEAYPTVVHSATNAFFGDYWDFELLSRPEPPKPWTQPREGDVWVLEFKGQILPPEAYSFTDGAFRPTNGRRWSVSPLETTILSARKLWPEN